MSEVMANLLGVEVSDIERADANLVAGEYPDDGRLEDEFEYQDWLEREYVPMSKYGQEVEEKVGYRHSSW